MGGFRSVDVRQLLHNKFVVVLGDSIQRSVYKDLVKFLQDDAFLSEDQLKKPPFHNIPHNLQTGIVEGNFFSATLANFHHLDVLDMHYHFRYDLRLRCRDGVHWNYLAHRKYTQILLTHIALAWGVEPPKQQMPEDSVRLTVPPSSAPCPKQQPARQEKELYSLGAAYMPGYTSFDGSEIRAVSGIQCPAYVTGEQLFSSDAVSPFVTDSPLLSANMTPGYFSPPPGPPPSSQYLPMMLLPANFGYFRPCDLFPPEAWKMRPPKRLKPGAGWRPPYRRPPIHPTGNY